MCGEFDSVNLFELESSGFYGVETNAREILMKASATTYTYKMNVITYVVQVG